LFAISSVIFCCRPEQCSFCNLQLVFHWNIHFWSSLMRFLALRLHSVSNFQHGPSAVIQIHDWLSLIIKANPVKCPSYIVI
jgi:predicted ferric reductase